MVLAFAGGGRRAPGCEEPRRRVLGQRRRFPPAPPRTPRDRLEIRKNPLPMRQGANPVDMEVTYRGTVYPWHCDHMGHMNVMWYVGKFDEATWQLFSAIGITPDYLRTSGRGMAAVDQRISYRREVRAGDVVLVRSAVLEARSKVIRFCHQMENAATGETAALTVITGVHIDTGMRRSCEIPEEQLARAKAMVTDFDPGI
jgi:acyl-CoA thioester hydrolase